MFKIMTLLPQIKQAEVKKRSGSHKNDCSKKILLLFMEIEGLDFH